MIEKDVMHTFEKVSEAVGTEYSVPEGVESIEELAFSGSDGLEKLYIPDSVRSIGNYAFMNCYSLREIRMPERMDRIGAGLFQNCWQLREVSLPEGTVMIGTDMFENCHGLTELSIPASVTKVARTALSGCRSLRAIHISPGQLMLLPPSARYTAALTYMENSQADDAEGAELIDGYVRERQRSFLDLAINRRSHETVRYMLKHGLADEEALREYIEKSVNSGRTEITALLLDSLKDGSTGSGLSEDPFA